MTIYTCSVYFGENISWLRNSHTSRFSKGIKYLFFITVRWAKADFPNAGVPRTRTTNVKRLMPAMAKKVYILGRVHAKWDMLRVENPVAKVFSPAWTFFYSSKKSRRWSQQLKAESRWLLFTVEICNVFWKNVTSGCHANASRAMRLRWRRRTESRERRRHQVKRWFCLNKKHRDRASGPFLLYNPGRKNKKALNALLLLISLSLSR